MLSHKSSCLMYFPDILQNSETGFLFSLSIYSLKNDRIILMKKLPSITNIILNSKLKNYMGMPLHPEDKWSTKVAKF
mgnify:CR=1 FL=1